MKLILGLALLALFDVYLTVASPEPDGITSTYVQYPTAELQEELGNIAQTILDPDAGKGIIYADESTGTMGKRLQNIDMENTEETGSNYRQQVFSTEDAGES